MNEAEKIANYYLDKDRELTENTALVELNVGKPFRKPAKLTAPKRKQFLEQYAKTGNMQKSAISIGVTRQSIYELAQRDDNFKKALEYVEDLITDSIEEVSLNLSLQPTRDGFNDRKLQLTARRPLKYNPKHELTIDHTIKVEHSLPKIREMLSRYGNAIDANYNEINELSDK